MSDVENAYSLHVDAYISSGLKGYVAGMAGMIGLTKRRPLSYWRRCSRYFEFLE